jgi:hypothetical protein
LASKKPVLLVLIGSLLIAWLLVASIHQIQPVVSAGGSLPSSPTPNSFQPGGSSLGNVSLFRLPSLNFHLPNLFNFKLPNLTEGLPNFNFKWPSFHWPNFGFGSGAGSGQGSGSGPGTGSSDGGSGGSGGTGGSGQGQSATTSRAQQQPILTIPRDLLIAIVIIFLIAAGTLLVLRSRNSIASKFKKNFQENLVEQLEPEIPLQKNVSQSLEQLTLNFEPDEKIVDYVGWGRLGGFLRPNIDQSQPLIWSLDEPLKFESPTGSKVYLGKDRAIETLPNETGDRLVGDVTFTSPTNLIHASLDGERDLKWIRAVHYNEDVMKHFRLNFLLSAQEAKELGVMTPREIVNKLASDKAELVKDKSGLFALARIFERAFYGKKMISRDEYELFLHSLSQSLISPKVIICGPKDTT